MVEYVSNSYEETLNYAEELAKRLPKGTVIGFIGDLGAGKTAFTTGFVKGLGIDAEVSSPTFTICNVYIGKENTAAHFDMYRIDNWDDLYTSGYFDYIDTEAYMLIEWSENIYKALDDDVLLVHIKKASENKRIITLMNKQEAENELGFIN